MKDTAGVFVVTEIKLMLRSSLLGKVFYCFLHYKLLLEVEVEV